ncbi:MAG: signal peptidase I [Flavobacteriales bacterium]|nr:signal peptidase I [Flavobacteriales bacterium]MCL4276922.1 signal peptidase I [Ignavibacteria bacterium]WKZ78583.1 MAG: DUF5684 domain-containing protein [Candidatus Kapabacteria bacterium]
MDDIGLGAAETGILAGAFAAILIVGLLVYLFIGFCLGKCFEKAGKPLWAGFIPIYNIVILLEIVGRPLWWLALFLLGFIPIVGSIAVLVIMAILWIDFAKSYGKDVVWGILLLFFNIIMLPIMAFSKEIAYVGPSAKSAAS